MITKGESATPEGTTERRRARRFPIELDVRYHVLDVSVGGSGSGKTINMSSTGVLFASEKSLVPGSRIELAIGWPAPINSSTGLQLVVQGRVVRAENGKVAMEIQQYEFEPGLDANQPPSSKPPIRPRVRRARRPRLGSENSDKIERFQHRTRQIGIV